MPLGHVLKMRTEKEAVDFAVTNRASDFTNYNLERPGGDPFERAQIERLLKSHNYKEYQRFAFDIRHERDANHCVTTLRPRTKNPQVLEILKDFVSRPKQKEMYVDPRHRELHRDLAGPVKLYMQSNLLTLMVDEARQAIHATEFSGPDLNSQRVSLDRVIEALEKYVHHYDAPIRLEHTASGEYRYDLGHSNDPLNPHNFGHLHVYHTNGRYQTIIRLERG